MKTLLIEVGCEEIPAAEAARTINNFEAGVLSLLKEEDLLDNSYNSKGYVAPRRLAIVVEGVKERQEDREEVVMGPPWDRAFDKDGNPTRVGLGFAKAKGVDVGELTPVETKRGKVAAVKVLIKGRSAKEVLEQALPEIIRKLPFKRSMRWGNNQGPFIRPVHWLLGMIDEEYLDFEVFGIKSGDFTHGHRFMAPQEIRIPHANQYEVVLREQGRVEPDPEKRKGIILQGLKDIEKKEKVELIDDEDLLNEVTHLVEFPVVLTGRFEQRFLKLPPEVLIEAMRRHQRYFAFNNPDGGLARVFGVVANNVVPDPDVVVRGNERVLSARLYDAEYFWDFDLKVGIDKMAGMLNERMFLTGLGSMEDKANRLLSLVPEIVRVVGVDVDVDALKDAARLCKADLMSEVVGEFPELQGVMGYYYALEGGYSENTALAIRDHYLPKGPEDSLPRTMESKILAIADKLDTLIGAFFKGMIPKGSKDPFALRRQAIGVLRILFELPVFVEVQPLVEAVASVLEKYDIKPSKDGLLPVYEFLNDRLSVLLKDLTGAPTDYVNAVLATPQLPPKEALMRIEALKRIASKKGNFRDLMLAFKRIKNIRSKAAGAWVRKADRRGVVEELLEEDMEIKLNKKADEDLQKVIELHESKDFDGFLELMYGYQDLLEEFFSKVRVLDASSEDIVKNRLALLGKVLRLFEWFADFSKISTR